MARAARFVHRRSVVTLCSMRLHTYVAMGGGVLLGLALRSRASTRMKALISSAPGIASSGALKKYPTPKPQTAAGLAAAQGNLELLRGMDAAALREADAHANTPLIWAADAGHGSVLEYLLQPGKAIDDVNVRGFLGNTALSRACRQGHEDAVRALLSTHGIDPNVCNDKLQYPLHFAAFQRHTGVVRIMLDSGKCDTHVVDRKGRTPAEDTKDAGIRQMIIESRK